MLRHLRWPFLPLLSLALIATLLAACQPATPPVALQGAAPAPMAVEPCNQQDRPVTKVLTPPQTWTQTVYFISGVHLYALDAGSGALRWCVEVMPNPHQAASMSAHLFGASPAPQGLTSMTVSNGSLYVNAKDGYTSAFDAASGALRWSRFTNTGLFSSSGPTVVNGTVYVGSDTLYALNAQDGSERWHYPLKDTVSAAPAVARGLVYFGSDSGHFYALDAASGTQRWIDQTDQQADSDPTVDQGRVFFRAGDNEQALYAVDAESGKLLWHTPPSYTASLFSAYGLLYVGGIDQALHALNEGDGTLRWSTPISAQLNHSPLVVQGILYLAADDGGLFALRASDGTLLWHAPLQGQVTGPVVLNNRVYVETTETGEDHLQAILHAFNAQDGVEDWNASVPWPIPTIGVAGAD